VEEKAHRHRGLYVLKSRGMPHSNDVSRYTITDRGVQILGGSTPPRTVTRRAR